MGFEILDLLITLDNEDPMKKTMHFRVIEYLKMIMEILSESLGNIHLHSKEEAKF